MILNLIVSITTITTIAIFFFHNFLNDDDNFFCFDNIFLFVFFCIKRFEIFVILTSFFKIEHMIAYVCDFFNCYDLINLFQKCNDIIKKRTIKIIFVFFE